jgi:hypothetical protein
VEPHQALALLSHQHELGGKPLRSFELMCTCIEGTTTSTGLNVRSDLVRGGSELGEHVSNEQMKKLCLQYHSLCSQ